MSAEKYLLLAFSRVLPDLDAFLQEVRMEERARNSRMQVEETEDPTDEVAPQLKDLAKDPELRVPVGRLRKAKRILDGCERETPKELYPEEKNARLLHLLAVACPSWIASLDEKSRADGGKTRWYAGAHRARGASLPEGHDGPKRLLLFVPRMSLFGNKADAGMPHMSSKITFHLTQLPAQAVQNLVIVSDSSLKLPAAIYGRGWRGGTRRSLG